MSSCSERKIDGSTDENLKSSIDQIKESLENSEAEKFDEALMYIAMQNLDLPNMLQSNLDSDEYAENFLNQVKDEIDGKTASEIISKAEALRLELEEKQRQQALIEIQELVEKQRKADLAKADLEKFEVRRSRFYKREDTFSDQPVIDLTVQNNTDFAISRVYFRGTYATPNRQVPWLVDEFNYSISGGLEPRETQSWSLAPNMFGEWGQLEEKSDAVLTVEVIRVDGPDGSELFSSQGLSDFEKERLEDLKQKYN